MFYTWKLKISIEHFIILQSFLGCSFVAINSKDCPCENKPPYTGCNLKECHSAMEDGQLCEADRNLPDEQTNFDVNNCPKHYDIFKCVRGR